MARKAPAEVQAWGLDGAKLRPVGVAQKRINRIPAGVYQLESDMGGWFLQPAEIVTDTLINVPSVQLNRVLARVARFGEAKEKYRNFGVLYKTGILMYGPAGCGKTALLRRLGNQFIAEGSIVLQASPSSKFTAIVLQAIRQVEPERLIVVEMEDLDSIVENCEEDLLALLDGSSQIDGVVYLATTNKIADLPDRIKNRPSRIDDRVYVGPPDMECRSAYLLSKWPGVNLEMAQQIAQMTDGFSYAHLKDVIISVGCLGHAPDESIRRLRIMMEAPTDEDERSASADDRFLAGVGVANGAAVATEVDE